MIANRRLCEELDIRFLLQFIWKIWVKLAKKCLYYRTTFLFVSKGKLFVLHISKLNQHWHCNLKIDSSRMRYKLFSRHNVLFFNYAIARRDVELLGELSEFLSVAQKPRKNHTTYGFGFIRDVIIQLRDSVSTKRNKVTTKMWDGQWE